MKKKIKLHGTMRALKKKKLMSFHDKIFLFMKKVEIVYVMI